VVISIPWARFVVVDFDASGGGHVSSVGYADAHAFWPLRGLMPTPTLTDMLRDEAWKKTWT
jgi:hypothetical protein